jgi:class 3 adenylate cyclase
MKECGLSRLAESSARAWRSTLWILREDIHHAETGADRGIGELPRKKKPSRTEELEHSKQRTYYDGAEYMDHPDRLLVENSDTIELYSMNLTLAQHWYAQAWRGKVLDLSPFVSQRIDGDMEPERAEEMKESGLVLAQCLRHGKGMPVVEMYNGHPVYGSAVDILIGEVFEAALGVLIEEETGIAGLTISPMHTGYALFEGCNVGRASIGSVARSVVEERPNLTPHAAPDGTVTIFFSDIEDSTALTERLGDTHWMQLLHEHNAIVRRERALHDGFEVKTIGDAFMLAFKSARDALRCAIGIQRTLAMRNTTAAQPIRVRIGVHTGEFIKESDDFFGRHVNVAARVGAKAAVGEILVSSLVRELVQPSGEFIFEACKPAILKGLSGKHTLYRVHWSEASC